MLESYQSLFSHAQQSISCRLCVITREISHNMLILCVSLKHTPPQHLITKGYSNIVTPFLFFDLFVRPLSFFISLLNILTLSSSKGSDMRPVKSSSGSHDGVKKKLYVPMNVVKASRTTACRYTRILLQYLTCHIV